MKSVKLPPISQPILYPFSLINTLQGQSYHVELFFNSMKAGGFRPNVPEQSCHDAETLARDRLEHVLIGAVLLAAAVGMRNPDDGAIQTTCKHLAWQTSRRVRHQRRSVADRARDAVHDT